MLKHHFKDLSIGKARQQPLPTGLQQNSFDDYNLGKFANRCLEEKEQNVTYRGGAT